MGFDRALLKLLEQPPRRTSDGMTLNGVFVLLADELVTMLRATMTQAEQDEVAPWVNRYTAAQCALWNVPLWAGQSSAVYWRIPAALWASPADPVPAKVKRYFAALFREDWP